MQEGSLTSTFMQKYVPPLVEYTLTEELYRIVNEMLEPYGKSFPRNFLRVQSHLPFDISKPNEHDTKAEFVREFEAVENSIANLRAAMENLMPRKGDMDHANMANKLGKTLSTKLRSKPVPDEITDPVDLIRNNVASCGGMYPSLFVMFDLLKALEDRLAELEDQKTKFWNLKHRAPDYYARAIALRLAKLFARVTGERPTTGTSAITGEVSTSYTRALEEVFEFLTIKSNVRTPAEWAVSQLTEDDLKPETETMGSLLGFPRPSHGARNAPFDLWSENEKKD